MSGEVGGGLKEPSGFVGGQSNCPDPGFFFNLNTFYGVFNIIFFLLFLLILKQQQREVRPSVSPIFINRLSQRRFERFSSNFTGISTLMQG